MISVNQSLLSGNELKYSAECIESGWIPLGLFKDATFCNRIG
jgi:hypothetical protein